MKEIELIGDNHITTSVDTPLRSDAFERTDEEKIENIKGHFAKIMEELGLDLTDESLSGTPNRVAKMYVKEMFYGLDPKNKPKLTTFDNNIGYKKMLVEQNIDLDSACEHHFLPITGHAHIAYIPKDKLIGISKLNRLVDYYSRRPQGQERLCLQIMQDLQKVLEIEDVMVVINAKHSCISSRGIKDKNSFTTTMEYGGAFNEANVRNEFFETIKSKING